MIASEPERVSRRGVSSGGVWGGVSIVHGMNHRAAASAFPLGMTLTRPGCIPDGPYGLLAVMTPTFRLKTCS